MSDARKVVLINLSSLFWTAWHSSGNDNVSAAKERTLASVKRCIGDDGALVAICCDAGRSFRKELLPTYKANRPEKDHASLGELDRVKDRLRADGLLLWEAPGFEADDIIATATAEAELAGHSVVIASADKDLLQLCGERVRCLRTHAWIEVGPDEVRAKFGVIPYRLGDWLALVGDKSDNVSGCPGVGEVTATKLLQKYHTLVNLYIALDAGEQVATPAINKALREHRAAVELARKLVTLRADVPINFADIYAERAPAPISGKDEDDDMDQPEAEYTNPISRGPGPQPQPQPERAPPQSVPEPPPTPPAETREMVHAPVSYEQGLEPTSIGTAFKLARGLYDSRLYSKFPNAEAIMAVIIRGREMGLGALTALDCFHVIEGRPAPHAWLIIARAKDNPDCEYFQCVESTDESATWVTKNRRNPKPTSLTYTLAQAKASGLVRVGQSGKPNQWMVRPGEMVRKTGGVQLARMEYPSSAMGLYAIEEMDEAA